VVYAETTSGIICLRVLAETTFSVEIEDRVERIYTEQRISLKRYKLMRAREDHLNSVEIISLRSAAADHDCESVAARGPAQSPAIAGHLPGDRRAA
jgi:hypothetical protein